MSRSLRQIAGPLFGIAIFAYLGFHAVHGDRGLYALGHYRAEVGQASEMLAALTAQRTELEHRASLLRPDSLDLDMLEERARELLNYAHPDDLVVPGPRAGGAAGLSQTPVGPITP